MAHLALLERLVPDGAPVAAYRARVEARAGGPDLAARVAGVLVGLATGPFRVQQAGWPVLTEARVALAEEWAAPAMRRSSSR